MKKVLCILLGALLLFSATGCKKRVDNSSNTIEIYVFEGGYGTAWLKAMEPVFEDKTGYNVEISAMGAQDNTDTMIRAGSSMTTDLFIVSDTVWDKYIDLGSKVASGYECALEPLDSVYEAEIDNGTTTVGEKMRDDWREYFYVDESYALGGHYYSMPWATGVLTMCYNKDIFDTNGLDHEPRTANELLEYCNTLKGKGVKALVYSATSRYWDELFNTWWVQYEGINGRENFFNCRLGDNMPSDPNLAMQIFDQEGIYEALYTVQQLIAPSNGYAIAESEYMEATAAQIDFFDGKAAMMPNGDWLENEMNSEMAEGMDIGNILPMQMPIISALSDKLSYWSLDASYTEAREKKLLTETKFKEYDDNLRALVDYVDGVEGAALPTYGTEEDVKADAAIVAESRKVQSSYGTRHSCAIPSYATGKEAAKEFLIFMASDEGLKIYAENTSGSTPPYKFDYENWEGYSSMSNFAKKKQEIIDNSTIIPAEKKYKTSFVGELTPIYSNIAIRFGSADSSTIMTANQYVNYLKTTQYNQSKLEKIMKDAGLIL